MPMPSSVTLYAARADFGGTTTLTSITPRVGDPSGFSINNAPALNSFGYAMTEAAGDNHYVTVTGLNTSGTGGHLSVLFQRNATPDTETVILGRPGDAYVYAGVGISGSGSTQQTQNTSFASMRVNDGTTVSSFTTTSTRGNVWNATFATSDPFVVTFIDLTFTGGSASPLYYIPIFRNLIGESNVGGIVKFTDSAEAADVEAKLLSEVA